MIIKFSDLIYHLARITTLQYYSCKLLYNKTFSKESEKVSCRLSKVFSTNINEKKFVSRINNSFKLI